MKIRISELREQQENTVDPVERKFIDERIASLAGAIGCIYVGGNSDVEQKEKFDRVDDSVCAVRSALEEGIVAGGGLALWNAVNRLKGLPAHINPEGHEDEIAAYNIVCSALREPLLQILDNAGVSKEEIINRIENDGFDKKNYGYDVKNEDYGDMFKMGVIDPLKVTKNALINASSVATTILSTNAIVTHARVGSREDTK